MKEALIYTASAIACLFMFGYATHMLVGGLVSEHTEHGLIIGVCIVAAGVMAGMLRQVIKSRQHKR